MWLVLVVGVLVSGVPFLLSSMRRQRREQLIRRQLRQSLHGIVQGLNVGCGFLQCLKRVSEDGEEPLANEFKAVVQSVQMGTALHQALGDLGRRIPLKEMAWFITAVQISQRAGGCLAEVLGTLAATLQERETLREKVAALTAQGKASGLLLTALPFLMIAVFGVIAPALVRPLFTTPYGQIMLAAVILLICAGGLMILKIVSIRVDK